MANYYVSNARGSDSTGVGTATNPWKTIGKAIGSSPAITLGPSGDALYIEPGIYREAVTLGLSPTSTAPLTIAGDFDGAGFLAGGYSTPVTGLVDWRAWSTDTATISGAAMLAASGQSYVTLRRVKMTSSSNSYWCVNGASGCTNWTIENCVFVGTFGATAPILFSGATGGVALNLTIRRCALSSIYWDVIEISAQLHTSEYNLGVVIEDCLIQGNRFNIYLTSAGTGSFLPTGIAIRYNTIVGGQTNLHMFGADAINLTTPITVRNNLIYGGSVGMRGNNTTTISENGNIILCQTARQNISAGANTVAGAGICPAIDVWDHLATGLPPLTALAPLAVSPIGGFGNYASVQPTVDALNRTRPEGCGSTLPACGAFERHDTGVLNTTYPDSGSAACLALTGPASHDVPVQVNAAATSLSVKVRWDGNHGDASKPQAVLLAEPAIGVAAQTLTASSTGGTGSTPNSYETLTFTGFTPTAAGVVMVRLVSRSAAGNGVAYFDSLIPS